MNIQIHDPSVEDLIERFHFYVEQQAGLGSYFPTNLYADIESLRVYGGTHRQAYRNYHRLLSNRFPFAVFYTIENDTHRPYPCSR